MVTRTHARREGGGPFLLLSRSRPTLTPFLPHHHHHPHFHTHKFISHALSHTSPFPSSSTLYPNSPRARARAQQQQHLLDALSSNTLTIQHHAPHRLIHAFSTFIPTCQRAQDAGQARCTAPRLAVRTTSEAPREAPAPVDALVVRSTAGSLSRATRTAPQWTKQLFVRLPSIARLTQA